MEPIMTSHELSFDPFPITSSDLDSEPPAYDDLVEAEIFIDRFQFLKIQNLCPTPRIAAALENALIAATRRLNSPSDEDYGTAARKFFVRWRLTVGDPAMFSFTASLISTFKDFITRSLSTDYLALRSFAAEDMVYTIAQLIGSPEERAEAMSELAISASDRAFSTWIKFPLEEMCIDVNHVVSKLTCLLENRGRLKSLVETPVLRKDARGLAGILARDKALLTSLQIGGYIDEDKSRSLLQGMEKIQKKHFKFMVDENNFKAKPF